MANRGPEGQMLSAATEMENGKRCAWPPASSAVPNAKGINLWRLRHGSFHRYHRVAGNTARSCTFREQWTGVMVLCVYSSSRSLCLLCNV